MSTSSSGECPPKTAELLHRIAGFGALSAEALAAQGGCSVAAMRGRLSAAERSGLLARWRPLVGEPALFTVTRRGLRAAGVSGMAPARVSAGGARHALACSRTVPALETAYPGHRVIGEPELRLHERERGALLYSVRVGGRGGGDVRVHRPDLVLLKDRHTACLPTVVEVELTVKSPRRLVAICRAWARCRHISGVIYLTTPEVERPLGRAIDSAQAGRRIVQMRLDSIEDR